MESYRDSRRPYPVVHGNDQRQPLLQGSSWRPMPYNAVVAMPAMQPALELPATTALPLLASHMPAQAASSRQMVGQHAHFHQLHQQQQQQQQAVRPEVHWMPRNAHQLSIPMAATAAGGHATAQKRLNVNVGETQATQLVPAVRAPHSIERSQSAANLMRPMTQPRQGHTAGQGTSRSFHTAHQSPLPVMAKMPVISSTSSQQASQRLSSRDGSLLRQQSNAPQICAPSGSRQDRISASQQHPAAMMNQSAVHNCRVLPPLPSESPGSLMEGPASAVLPRQRHASQAASSRGFPQAVKPTPGQPLSQEVAADSEGSNVGISSHCHPKVDITQLRQSPTLQGVQATAPSATESEGPVGAVSVSSDINRSAVATDTASTCGSAEATLNSVSSGPEYPPLPNGPGVTNSMRNSGPPRAADLPLRQSSAPLVTRDGPPLILASSTRQGTGGSGGEGGAPPPHRLSRPQRLPSRPSYRAMSQASTVEQTAVLYAEAEASRMAAERSVRRHKHEHLGSGGPAAGVASSTCSIDSAAPEGEVADNWPRGSSTWGGQPPNGALRRVKSSLKGGSTQSGSVSYSVITHSGGSSPTNRGPGPYGFSRPANVRRARSAASVSEDVAAAPSGFHLQNDDFPPMAQGLSRPRYNR